MKTSIIIPIYNEEKTLKEVISKTQEIFNQDKKNTYEIILVNDGSTDKTLEILANIKNPNIKVLTHSTNYGKGKALQTGIEKATGEYIAIQDADLEYDPKNLFELVSFAINKNVVVYGIRDGKSGYFSNRIGNKILSLSCNILFSSNMSDIYTCYKVAPRELLQSLELKSNGFEIEAEITAKILKKKIEILEIPISYTPRSFRQGKHIKWKDGYKGILKLIEIKFS